MSKWSKELQEKTRLEVFPGAMMKNEDHDYGFYFEEKGKIVIKGVADGSGFMPMPSDEVKATFDTVNQMVEAGWVMD